MLIANDVSYDFFKQKKQFFSLDVGGLLMVVQNDLNRSVTGVLESKSIRHDALDDSRYHCRCGEVLIWCLESHNLNSKSRLALLKLCDPRDKIPFDLIVILGIEAPIRQ